MSSWELLSKSKTKRIFKDRDKISKHLECSICSDIFEDPVRTICGHTFCYVCIQQWAIFKHQCPLCKTIITKRKLEVDRIARSLIHDFEVECFHPGCNWSDLESLRGKHQRTCSFRPTKVSSVPKQADIVEVDNIDPNTNEFIQLSSDSENGQSHYHYQPNQNQSNERVNNGPYISSLLGNMSPSPLPIFPDENQNQINGISHMSPN